MPASQRASRPAAREIEAAAARARAPREARGLAESGEAAAMLVRRGFHPVRSRRDLPFPPDLDEARAEHLSARLGHYAFRLFLRGAIQRGDGFAAAQTTAFLKPAQARAFAELLVELGLAARLAARRYRLLWPARDFGRTLEWYVGRELKRRFGFDVATGVKFGRGVGGDLDVVAAAEGKLVYLELKSSPPKHLSAAEVSAFFDRLLALRPDLALFVVDTALRLSDKVVPMLEKELARRRPSAAPVPRRIERELWALTGRLYLVNAKPDLIGNIGRALAEAFRALSPAP